MAQIKLSYAELCAQSCYSFLEGASTPEEIIAAAIAHEYSAIAITDRYGVYGLARAHAAHQKSPSLKLLIGAQVEWQNGALYLLAQNREGYGNLCELLSHWHTEAKLPLADFSAHLIALYAPPLGATSLTDLPGFFPGRLYLIGSRFFDAQDKRRMETLSRLSQQTVLPIVASLRPLMHAANKKPLQDTLTAIRYTIPVSRLGLKREPNAERRIKSLSEIQALFANHPEWLTRTQEVAERCQFSLSELRYQYPSEWLPENHTSESYLRELVYSGTKLRYPKGLPEPARLQIEKELSLIQELGYEDYFLTIWDIIQFAKEERILFQGRGSAANSIVSYLLGITSVDPIRQNLLFERFISRERSEPPDIDIDFEHERREEVIQYIYRRYGRMRAAITAENICFRRRSAMREVGKAWEIPLPVVEGLLTQSFRRTLNEIPEEDREKIRQGMEPEKLQHYLNLVDEIQGLPRHIGTHVGGFVLSQEKLSRYVPIEKAAMADRTIVQWDKNDLDTLGFTRVDILGLGILTALRKALDLTAQVHGKAYTLATLPAEDPKTYDAICRADTVGVFQIESRAQMNMLPRLKPRTYYDLVVEISLVRPGPIVGEMVHPYLRRRLGLEKVEYPHPDLESILSKTYGVPLFQEQIMQMAMQVAGFSGGEADELRRAMGIWRRDGRQHLNRIGEKFRRGLVARGISEEFAKRIYSQIEGFAEYGFPESHAASFALLAYASSYLKTHFPDAYATALLNSQPMGFYRSHSILYDAIRHGVKTLPINVLKSGWDNRLEKPGQIRLGFREIRGLPEKFGRALESIQTLSYCSLESWIPALQATLTDFPLRKRDLLLVAASHGFLPFGLERRPAFWEIQKLKIEEPMAFQAGEEPLLLPPEDNWESIQQDFEAQGVCLSEHPMHFLRKEVQDLGAKSSREIHELPHGRTARTAGIVICRQMPPTANGVLFITLEDEFGFTNLVIWNQVFQKYRDTLLNQSFLLARGKIQKDLTAGTTHLIVTEVTTLFTNPWRVESTDFG